MLKQVFASTARTVKSVDYTVHKLCNRMYRYSFTVQCTCISAELPVKKSLLVEEVCSVCREKKGGTQMDSNKIIVKYRKTVCIFLLR